MPLITACRRINLQADNCCRQQRGERCSRRDGGGDCGQQRHCQGGQDVSSDKVSLNGVSESGAVGVMVVSRTAGQWVCNYLPSRGHRYSGNTPSVTARFPSPVGERHRSLKPANHCKRRDAVYPKGSVVCVSRRSEGSPRTSETDTSGNTKFSCFSLWSLWSAHGDNLAKSLFVLRSHVVR